MEYQKKVIPFKPREETWAFLSFETASGVDVAVDWDVEKTLEAEFAFNTLLKSERKTKNYLDWPSWRHKLQGDAGKYGLIELGFKADKRPYRILAMFDGSMRLVILCICYHKGSVCTPKGSLATATNRAKLVLAKKAKLNVIKVTDDL